MEVTAAESIIVFIIAMITFLVIDLAWLGFVAKDFYRKYLGKWMAKTPNWTAAIIFYSLFIIGLMYFAILPAIREESLGLAMSAGAAYGFFTYITYDLTNLAVMKDWPVKLVIVDVLWGTFLAWVVSIITYSIYIGIS